MNNTKYLLSGNAVEVIQTLPNGFLVANIYETGEVEEREYEPIIDSGHPYFVSEVFDKAPTQKQDDTIRQLTAAIQQYTDERNAIQKELWNIRSEKEKTIKDLKAYNNPSLSLLTNVLDGTITHFVFTQYGKIHIKATKDVRDCDYSYKLNITYEMNGGKATWTLYTSRDYGSIPLLPCKSYEEALTEATKLIEEGFNNPELHWADEYIKSAKALNIEIPSEYAQKNKDKKIQSAAHTVSAKVKELEAAQEQYNKLKS